MIDAEDAPLVRIYDYWNEKKIDKTNTKIMNWIVYTVGSTLLLLLGAAAIFAIKAFQNMSR